MFEGILSRYWWTTLFRGILWMLFGLLTLFQPGISLLTLTLLFGACALIDGIVSVASAFAGSMETERSWIQLLSGTAAVGVGLLTLFSPQITAYVLLICIAFWAIATGLIDLVAAVRLRHEMQGEFWLGLAGLASVAFGVFVLARPGAGALSVLWAIAFYAMVLGVTLVVMAFEMRAFAREVRG